MFSTSLCFCVLLFFYNVMCQLQEGSPCVVNVFNGTCVPVNKCKSVIYDIKYVAGGPKICTFRGNTPIICCSDCELVDEASKYVVNSRGFYYKKTGRKAYDKCLEYLVDLDYPCRPTLRTIRYLHNNTCYKYNEIKASGAVGGVNAQRGEYPHMALLGYGETLDSAQWRCGGSVISDKYILTAAHCTGYGRLGNVKYVGLGLLKRSDPINQWQIYDVKNIITHPDYKSPVKYNDIALLEVTTQIKFSRSVLPACLSTGEYNESPATATGWGYLGPNAIEADTLQVVELMSYHNLICAGLYLPERLLEKGYDPVTQSCYGNTANLSDTCEGDSGGPLQIRSNIKGCMFIIVGVTSTGKICGDQGNAGLYTRVSHFVPWIENIVWP